MLIFEEMQNTCYHKHAKWIFKHEQCSQLAKESLSRRVCLLPLPRLPSVRAARETPPSPSRRGSDLLHDRIRMAPMLTLSEWIDRRLRTAVPKLCATDIFP